MIEFDQKVVDEIIYILERHHFRQGSDAARYILLTLTIGSYRAKSFRSEISNEELAEMMISEMNTSLKAHFGEDIARDLMKNMFVTIIKSSLMGEDREI